MKTSKHSPSQEPHEKGDAVVCDCESEAPITDKKDQDAASFKDYRRIFSFSDRLDWTLNGIALIAAIASGVSLALVNIVLGNFVSVVQEYTQTGNVDYFRSKANQYALYFVYLGLARLGCTYIHTTCLSISSTRIARTIRYRFLAATLSQNVAYFDTGSNGSVSHQVVTNGNLIQNGTAEKLGLTVQGLASFVAAFVVAFIIQWKLTLITLCIVPLIIIITLIAAGIDAGFETSMLAIYGKAGSFAEDVISSIRTVHAFWARPKLVKTFDSFLQEAHEISHKKGPLYLFLFSTEFFMVNAGFALAFWEGMRMYNSGEIQHPGTIVTVLFSVVVAATSITHMAANIVSFVGATSAAATMFKTIDRESTIDSLSQHGLKPESIRGDISIRGVNFAYPTRPEVQVLQDMTLSAPSGKVTALVGPSGSGKSTIIGLLERWYDSDEGTIEIDGISVQDLNLQWLRTHVRLVQQEPVLFMGTVFDNVKYGLIGTVWEHASIDMQRELVVNACKLANAHDFVTELPNGYDTECGERAGLLSGGQKQRIAIARSVISNPSILLLDEATSALDPHAEGVVQEALDKASRNRTTIVIAHKLATIKNADNIVVMSKGSIVEQGTHASLLKADGMYARLVEVQDLGELGEKDRYSDDFETLSSRTLVGHRDSSHTKHPYYLLQEADERKERHNYERHPQMGMMKIVWRLLTESKNLSGVYMLIVACCIIGGAVYPAQALLFAQVMEVFNLDREARSDRANFLALMFFIVAIACLCYGALGWTTSIVVQELSHTYRRLLFDLILRQDMQFFDRPENTAGALTSKLSSHPQSITELMGFNLALILVSIITIVASSVLAIVYSWKLGLVVVLAGIPPLAASGVLRIRLDVKMQDDNAKQYSSSATIAGEAVAAIRTVASLALEPTVLSRFDERLQEVVKLTIPKTMFIMVWVAFTQTVEFFFLALGFWYGCRLLSNGEISLNAFYVASVGVFFCGQSAAYFFTFSTSISKAKPAANYIFWLRSLRPIMSENDSNETIGPLAYGDQSLFVDNIRFSYPLRPEAQVLKGVSLHVKPGQFVALVGASGCGKSTMVAMLERFYDPVTGTITISRADISRMNPRLYRNLIGLVQQEPTLYQATIRENIALGLNPKTEDVSDEQVIQACKQANAWEFISSLPDGLGTFCGSRGLSLSGGQRQRIAIARALIRNPKILLLDEATSALDTESERVVQAALTEALATGNRITVAVAHRLSTVKDADLICVFQGGRIVEAGKHKDLLEQRGLYARMCEAQSLDRTV